MSHMVKPTAAAVPPTPPDADTVRALINTAVYIREHGVTPGQAAALRKVAGYVVDSGDPSGAARQVLDLIDADCDRLNGQWEDHKPESTGEVVHRGAEHTAAGAYGRDLLTHQLVQWGDDAPYLLYSDGGKWPDLDLAATDELITAVGEQYGSLLVNRAHLAAALGQPTTVPAEWDNAATLRTAGADGAILRAYLYTPTEHETGHGDNPTRLAVYSESGTEDALDLAGAQQLLADLTRITGQVAAMVAVLASKAPVTA